MTALFSDLLKATNAQTKEQTLAVACFAMQHLIENGVPVQKAMAAILGAGQHDRMVSELYDIFRAEV